MSFPVTPKFIVAAALLAAAVIAAPSYAENVQVALSVEQDGAPVQAFNPTVRIGDSAAACAGRALPVMAEGVSESAGDDTAVGCAGWRFSASVSRVSRGELTIGWVAALREPETEAQPELDHRAVNFAGATTITPGAPAQVVESAEGYVVRLKVDAVGKAGR